MAVTFVKFQGRMWKRKTRVPRIVFPADAYVYFCILVKIN